MPTIYIYRLWCASCNEYTEHHRNDFTDKNYVCRSCKTVFSDTPLCDIPEEKVLAQRKRYTESRIYGSISNQFLASITGHSGSAFTDPVGGNVKYIESDAGQKEIDEENTRLETIQWLQRSKERSQREEELAKYKNLGRNEPCLCGSGKKYKHCHLKQQL